MGLRLLHTSVWYGVPDILPGVGVDEFCSSVSGSSGTNGIRMAVRRRYSFPRQRRETAHTSPSSPGKTSSMMAMGRSLVFSVSSLTNTRSCGARRRPGRVHFDRWEQEARYEVSHWFHSSEVSLETRFQRRRFDIFELSVVCRSGSDRP